MTDYSDYFKQWAMHPQDEQAQISQILYNDCGFSLNQYFEFLKDPEISQENKDEVMDMVDGVMNSHFEARPLNR